MSRQRHRNFWQGAKPLQIPSGGTFLPNQTLLLRASNDFFVAGAIWRRKDGQWACIQTAPILRWMLKLSPTEAKLELARRGCSWEWITTREKRAELDPPSDTVESANRSAIGTPDSSHRHSAVRSDSPSPQDAFSQSHVGASLPVQS
jgi:hypothetical protein